MLTQIQSIGLAKESPFFSQKPVRLHSMVISCGHSIENSPAYDWHGLRRGSAPLALFQYTLSGKGMLSYKGKEQEAPEGHAMILHFPFENRYWLPKGWGPWEFLWVCVNGKEALRIWLEIEHKKGPLLRLEADSASLGVAQDIFERAVNGKFTNPFQASAMAYQLSMALAQDAFLKPESVSRPDSVQRAILFCHINLADPSVGIERMAEASGASRFHFSRLFRQSEGISPWTFLVNLRIEQAARLLKNSALSIKETAAQSGFSDANYFCKVFRKKIGVTPAAFRKSGMY